MAAGPVGTSWASGSWSVTAWTELTWADAIALAFVLDMNTRLRVYLCSLYSVPDTSDLTPMVTRYVNAQSGEMNARVQQLIDDATDAMT